MWGSNAAAQRAAPALSPASADSDDEGGMRRSLRRQVKGMIVAVVLLALVFVSATVHAILVIDNASVAADRDRAAVAVAVAGGAGSRLDDAAVRWMADTFKLRNARLVPPAAVAAHEAAVPAGDRMLAFEPRRLGTDTFRRIAPIRIGIAVTLVLAICLVLQRLVRLARLVDEQRRAARRLASIDPLTGLSNRLHFNEVLRRRIEAAAAGQGHGALLLLDLDEFKTVNDSQGHVAGDKLLQEVAQRLCAHADPGDAVARLGGDEFAIIRCSGLDRGGLEDYARGLIRLISAPIALEGRSVVVAASVGVARIGPQTREPEALIRAADAALYRAKTRPGGAFELVGGAPVQALALGQHAA